MIARNFSRIGFNFVQYPVIYDNWITRVHYGNSFAKAL